MLLVNLFVVGLVALFLHSSEQQYRQQAAVSVENLSRVLEESLAGRITAINLALMAVMDEMSRQQVVGGIDPESLNHFIEGYCARLPMAYSVRVADAEGHIVYGIGVRPGSAAAVADRDHFHRLHDDPDAGLVVSKPILDRINGTWAMVFARRVSRPDGSFDGVVYATVAVETIGRIFSAINLEPNGSVTLWDDAPSLFVRYNVAKGISDEVGEAVPSNELRALVASGIGSGLYSARTHRDGRVRVNFFRKLRGTSLNVVVGLAEVDYLAPWHREALHMAGLAGGFVLVTTLAAAISVRAWMERQRSQADARLASSVFENTAEAIVVTDAHAKIVSVNPAFAEITGYTADEVLGRAPRVLKSDRHDAAFYKVLWDELLNRGKWQGQIWNRRKDGEAFLAWQTITAVRGADGRIARYVSVFNDITEMYRKDEHIRHQAYHDPLTGLPNRLLLQDRLAHAIEIARRGGAPVAVMFLDLDRFKFINDSLGHDVGDLLLKEVAERLLKCLRRSDTVARLGGDEFVVVLADFDSPGEAAEVAEKIVKKMAEPAVLKGHDVRIGASIGIAIFPRDGDDATTLMKGADTAMYRAKSTGRNSFRFFDADMDGEAVERLKLEAGLRRALDAHEFELFYQPKVDLASGAVSGAEALIRWNSAERGLVPPLSFIPLAEETGLILEIGDWVLEEACRQMAEWKTLGLPPLKVAVNVSGRQFLDEGLADKIVALLDVYGLAPTALEIELTESAVMSDADKAVRQIQRLRTIGVDVSVDDFGTGYSSLSYLKRLPLNTIKIDKSFVRNMDTDPDNAAIVGAILGLAHSLGMSVVAEGVETEGEEASLRHAGCLVAQGYKYSEPLPAAVFQSRIRAGLAHTIEAPLKDSTPTA